VLRCYLLVWDYQILNMTTGTKIEKYKVDLPLFVFEHLKKEKIYVWSSISHFVNKPTNVES